MAVHDRDLLNLSVPPPQPTAAPPSPGTLVYSSKTGAATSFIGGAGGSAIFSIVDESIVLPVSPVPQTSASSATPLLTTPAPAESNALPPADSVAIDVAAPAGRPPVPSSIAGSSCSFHSEGAQRRSPVAFGDSSQADTAAVAPTSDSIMDLLGDHEHAAEESPGAHESAAVVGFRPQPAASAPAPGATPPVASDPPVHAAAPAAGAGAIGHAATAADAGNSRSGHATVTAAQLTRRRLRNPVGYTRLDADARKASAVVATARPAAVTALTVADLEALQPETSYPSTFFAHAELAVAVSRGTRMCAYAFGGVAVLRGESWSCWLLLVPLPAVLPRRPACWTRLAAG